MNLVEHVIQFSEEELTLTNQRALYWDRAGVLVLSDLHLGKAAHFRKHGIALPTQTGAQDLQRLGGLLDYYKPQEVIIVGDLIHAGTNKEVESFRDFRERFADVCFRLIKGNHDRIPARKLAAIGIDEVNPQLQVGSLTFSHQTPTGTLGKFIVGHQHPGVRIRVSAKGYARLPCFVVSPAQITLPAFSKFTGLDTVNIPKDAICYPFTEEWIAPFKSTTPDL